MDAPVSKTRILFDEWIDFDNRLKKKYGEGYVPSEVFFSYSEGG